MKLIVKTLLLMSASLVAFLGHAEVKFNGFASVVTGIDLNDENAQADYDSTHINSVPETKLGLQLTGELGEGARIIGQAIARGDASSGFVPNYEWLYFDFNVGKTDKLKIGRIRVPFYKYSDYLDVGYAYHWIEPPQSMYSLQFSNVDGISYNRNGTIGSIESAITAVYGRFQGDLIIGGEPAPTQLKNLGGLNWNLTMDTHEVYVGYFQADVTFDISQTSLAGVIGADPSSPSIAQALGLDTSEVNWDGDLGYFIGAGYKGSFGDLEVFAEYSQVVVEDSISADTAGGYAGIAYPMGDYLLHVTYGTRSFSEIENDNPAADVPVAALGNATFNSFVKSISNGTETEMSVGVRKDIGAGAALKLELEQFVDSQERTGAPGADETDLTGLYLKVGIEAVF